MVIPLAESSNAGMSAPNGIILYSCFYGAPEPLNHNVFGSARGKYPCYVFSDNPALPVADGVTLIHDPLVGLDANRASRRAKLMPDRYLPPCDWSIYLDNNMSLIADPAALIGDLAQYSANAVYVTKHPDRDCAFDEARVCSKRRLDDPAVIDRQMKTYASLGFEAHAGLPHGGFLIRRHTDLRLAKLSFHWFEHVLAFARRDQLSFSFVARQVGIEPCYIDNQLEGRPIFQWPVYQQSERRDWMSRKPKKRSFWSRVIKPRLPWRRKKQGNSSVDQANSAVSDIYRTRLGSVKAQPKGEGAVLIKYETDKGFDYEAYREIQNIGNRLKLNCQWVGRDQIEVIAGLVKKFVTGKLSFGICHGTRRGNEQLWLIELLGDNIDVIGTEIADTATQFPHTVQWDFHKRNEAWVGKADFVYSNSWDHSYDPESAFAVWIESLKPGGVMLLDWTEGHSETGVTEMDPFGASLDHLVAMLNDRFKKLGQVVLTHQGKKHATQQITTVIFQRTA